MAKFELVSCVLSLYFFAAVLAALVRKKNYHCIVRHLKGFLNVFLKPAIKKKQFLSEKKGHF